jgi:hypothetical protein
MYLEDCGSQDSIVGLASGYRLDDHGVGVRVLVGSRIFFPMSSGPALGRTQPPIQWVLGALSPGVKGPWREADHSPPTNAEVKKMFLKHKFIFFLISRMSIITVVVLSNLSGMLCCMVYTHKLDNTATAITDILEIRNKINLYLRNS